MEKCKGDLGGDIVPASKNVLGNEDHKGSTLYLVALLGLKIYEEQ